MKQNKIIPTLLAIAFIVIAWQVIALSIGFPAIFPSVIDLLKETGRLVTSDDFFIHIIITILRGLIGFIISFVIAFLFALTSTFSSFWKTFFRPFIIVSRSIPIISLVLIALLWFSPPQLPIFIALVTMFPILYQNILIGLEQVDSKLLEMSTVFGKTKINQLFHIYLPSAKLVIFDGIKTAMGFGWRAIIMGEVLAQPIHGIGTAMKQAQSFINISEVIAWTVVAVAISYLFEYIVRLIQKINIESKLPKASEFKYYKSIQSSDIKTIKLVNVKKQFNPNIVFDSLDLEFDSSALNCLKGSSGRGKTTLLKLISGILQPNSGEIILGNEFSLAYSFQDLRLLPWLTVTENIGYVMHQAQLHKQEISNRIAFLLEKMELSDYAHKYPHQLSGGQQQRVVLARALAAQSDILLLDEPLTGLDSDLKIRILDFISEWMKAYRPLVIWATHEDIHMEGVEVIEIML